MGGHLIIHDNSLKGGCIQMGICLFSQAANDRISGHSLKLQQGRFSLDIWKNFFMERIIKDWNGLARRVVES